jgi:hypothetical protein
VSSQVKEFFYENDDFAEIFETWAEDNCSEFVVDEEEHKLQYTELHNEFRQMFEDQIEGFIESLGHTVFDFYDLLKAVRHFDEIYVHLLADCLL